MFITEAPSWLAGWLSGGSEVQDELGLVTISYHDWTGLGFIFPIAVSSHHICSSHGTGSN